MIQADWCRLTLGPVEQGLERERVVLPEQPTDAVLEQETADFLLSGRGHVPDDRGLQDDVDQQETTAQGEQERRPAPQPRRGL